MSFVDACKNNNIALAKTLPIPDQQKLNRVFIDVCKCGHLEVAQWLHRLGVDISAQDNDAIIWACIKGHLVVAQWLHSKGANISARANYAIRWSCSSGRLEVAQWLHSQGADISAKNNEAIILACIFGKLKVAQWLHSQGANISAQNDNAIISSCYNDNINIVEWLIDIHYKYGGYVKFNNYDEFSDEIKNLLIDNNLIDPSTLSEDDLAYYLARTNNFVPPDFTTLHAGFNVKYRGKHTKPAPRE